MTIIIPTVGRIVWYWHEKKQSEDHQPCAAIVTFVHNDRSVNLAAFSSFGQLSAFNCVVLLQEGDSEPDGPHAQWMPYQLGQAKKYEEVVFEGKVTGD